MTARSLRIVERLGAPIVRGRERTLVRDLSRAGVRRRPEEFAGAVALWSLAAAAAALALGALAASVVPSTRAMLALAVLPFVVGALTFFGAWRSLGVRALLRARRLDAQLPHALIYIATMSSAGFPPQRIFAQLAGQQAYGAVAEEAALIARDMDLLGRDFVTALVAASDRSPSLRFQDFLQGAITTLTAGGRLEEYFLAKSEQFLDDNERMQGKYVESLGLFAESYITLVVAGPLFVIILLSVMLAFGSGARDSLEGGYILVLLVVPLAQAGFAVSIQAAAPEAGA